MRHLCRQQPDLVRRFLRATARGFQHAAQHPDQAADMLLAAAPHLDAGLVRASQALVSKVGRVMCPSLLYLQWLLDGFA